MEDTRVRYVTHEEFIMLAERVGKAENRITRNETNQTNMDEKLRKIDNNTTWVLRLVIGAIIMTLLYTIINKPESISSALSLILGG